MDHTGSDFEDYLPHVVDHTESGIGDTSQNPRKPMKGAEMLRSEPQCAFEFTYGFLEGSDLIGNGQNMVICKMTMGNRMIRPAHDITMRAQQPHSLRNTFASLYESYSMMYYADTLAHSCTSMLHMSFMTTQEVALFDVDRIFINSMHNFYDAYANYKRVK